MRKDTLYLVSAPIRKQFDLSLHYISRSNKVKCRISDTAGKLTAPSVSHSFLPHPVFHGTEAAEPLLGPFRVVKHNERGHGLLYEAHRNPMALHGRLPEPAVQALGLEHSVE